MTLVLCVPVSEIPSTEDEPYDKYIGTYNIGICRDIQGWIWDGYGYVGVSSRMQSKGSWWQAASLGSRQRSSKLSSSTRRRGLGFMV